ncbi:MAG: 1,4-alpha-glucan branching protein GlgB [Sphingomonadaceae bacterium]
MSGAALVGDAEAAEIVAGLHADPFAILGVHETPVGFVARCFIPGAEKIEAWTLAGDPVGNLQRIHPDGLFAGAIDLPNRQPLRYRVEGHDAQWQVTDAYSFGPVLGPLDDYYAAEGSHLRLFDKLGAHPLHHEGVDGVHFAVWAPNAKRVSVVGDFNDWDGRRHVMRHRRDTGIHEIFLPDAHAGQRYKYEIIGADGNLLPLKADPFAFRAELRPGTASIIEPPLTHHWGDDAHCAFWASADIRRQPVSIYEVHAGSWRMRADGGFLSWDELAEQLIPYVVATGFTHIEFLPISEYPYDPSWGYQPTGLFAPTARFGEPEGFARFVDGAHRAGIGIILDWVPAHFPMDDYGLARFDGTALYEHADPRQGFHPDWNTAIYNYGRREVSTFLVNNALFWLERYHVDGLRVDAVASMLYRDYSRPPGSWIPNHEGGRENWEAAAFLQRLNRAVYGEHPGSVTIAEESTAWPLVTAPTDVNGLGFGLKWNMGFMHDTLQWLRRDPVHRRHHHDEITFGLMYAFSENFVLPLSHDEVVHGKGSLLEKMAGDDWQKFATLRAYYGFMWGYPGKKLLFMGQEFAQRREWSEARPLDWELPGAPAHAGVRQWISDLNHLYRSEPALHARDCEAEGFSWLVVDDREGSSFAWARHAPGAADIVVISHFTPVRREGYHLRLPHAGRWAEVLNSDAAVYGGSGTGNNGMVMAGEDGGAIITLPPLATIMLRYVEGGS